MSEVLTKSAELIALADAGWKAFQFLRRKLADPMQASGAEMDALLALRASFGDRRVLTALTDEETAGVIPSLEKMLSQMQVALGPTHSAPTVQQVLSASIDHVRVFLQKWRNSPPSEMFAHNAPDFWRDLQMLRRNLGGLLDVKVRAPDFPISD